MREYNQRPNNHIIRVPEGDEKESEAKRISKK